MNKGENMKNYDSNNGEMGDIYKKIYICTSCKTINISDAGDCVKCGKKFYKTLYMFLLTKNLFLISLILILSFVSFVVLLINTTDEGVIMILKNGYIVLLILFAILICLFLNKRIANSFAKKYLIEKELYANYFKKIDIILDMEKSRDYKYNKLLEISKIYNSDYIKQKRLELLSDNMMKKFKGRAYEAENLIVAKENDELIIYIFEVAIRERLKIGRETIDYFMKHYEHIRTLKEGELICAKVLFAGITLPNNDEGYYNALENVKMFLNESEQACAEKVITDH